MPRRDDIQSILIIGAGPIIIGQACEFDYSGAQACKALKAEGYRVILVNSNPATIMTDPGMADATYIEPITPATVARIIEAERPDALLPTMGGQTALNTALALDKDGTLQTFGVEMIGARPDSIEKAEDRELFRVAMEKIGLQCARARTVSNFEDALDALDSGRWFGEVITEGGGEPDSAHLQVALQGDQVRLHPATRIAWWEREDTIDVFIDGGHFEVPLNSLEPLMALCSGEWVQRHELAEATETLFEALRETGALTDEDFT